MASLNKWWLLEAYLLCNPCALHNYKRVREHAYLINFHVNYNYSYVPTHIAVMRTKEVNVLELLNEVFLVKIANSNVVPTLRGFRWYPYFGAQE